MMKTEILNFNVSAFKIPYTKNISISELEKIDGIDKETISEWQPEDKHKIILTAYFEIGVKGKTKKKEYPYFYTTITTNNVAHLLKENKRLYIIPFYENWEELFNEMKNTLETNLYSSYDEFIRGISKRFEFEYKFGYEYEHKFYLK